MRKTVLITGAAGNLGGKIRRHFEALGWTLRLVDLDAGGDAAVTAADLSVWNEAWVSLFEGVDAVIHMAGQPSPRAPWSDIVPYNIDLTQNVFEAAVRGGAKRLVFASSNWVVAGRRFAAGRLTTDMEPDPINAYGVSKLVGERLGRSYHERWGLSVICFRIGYCQRGENRPGTTMNMGSWGQSMWLSDRDLCQAMERAVLADAVGFAVLNLMSDNPGMRWDIDTTREAIGYVPQDGAAPHPDRRHACRRGGRRPARAGGDGHARPRARSWLVGCPNEAADIGCPILGRTPVVRLLTDAGLDGFGPVKQDFPRWTLSIQVMTEDQAKAHRFNQFDVTKVWPKADFSMIEVGASS